MSRIRILPPETARLIAAGEVIDRPAAALRELLDNALDSGATEIEVRVESGGIASLSVTDNGSGMERDDLAMSVLAHATSKISNADDLLTAKTLGFRGEALASIAAAARLEIVSKDEASPVASRLLAGPGLETRVEAVAGRRGTSVSVSGIFERYPARRQFLKRPQSEAALCRQVYADKALAHPGILFRWLSGTSRETSTPQSRARRVCDFHPEIPFSLTHCIVFSGRGFSGEVVLCGPSFHRTDRRLLQVFVNRRRVQEWGISGAVEQAFSGYLPGGMKPCAFIFAEVDPSLADFNIHPAKREVRFKSPEEIRHSIISAIQSFLGQLAKLQPEETSLGREYDFGLELPYAGTGAFETRERSWNDYLDAGTGLATPPGREDGQKDDGSVSPPLTGSGTSGLPRFRYLGQVLGPFLVFEMENSLYILDQHAAHERVIYDKLCAAVVEVQPLLVPIPVEPEDREQEEILTAMQPELAEAGFGLVRSGRIWSLESVPAVLGDRAFGLIEELATSGTGGAFRSVRASIACRAAVKDGDILDRNAAEDLIAMSLRLPDPRCPHGRPIWTRLTRDQLYRLVGRIVEAS